MNWIDYLILITIGISIVIGLLRGFTREALSLAGWVVAIWVTITFSADLQDLLVPYTGVKALRMAMASTILFVITLLLAALVNYLASALLERSGLTGTDRVIGVVFGFLRGFSFVMLLVLLAGMTDIPKAQGWRHSQVIHYFQNAALWLRQFMPSELAASIRY